VTRQACASPPAALSRPALVALMPWPTRVPGCVKNAAGAAARCVQRQQRSSSPGMMEGGSRPRGPVLPGARAANSNAHPRRPQVMTTTTARGAQPGSWPHKTRRARRCDSTAAPALVKSHYSSAAVTSFGWPDLSSHEYHPLPIVISTEVHFGRTGTQRDRQLQPSPPTGPCCCLYQPAAWSPATF
jgi:hypothetical protein